MVHSSKTLLKDRIYTKHQLDIELYDIHIWITACAVATSCCASDF